MNKKNISYIFSIKYYMKIYEKKKSLEYINQLNLFFLSYEIFI